MSETPSFPSRVWLVCNEASGSNDEAALTALEQDFSQAGLDLVGRTVFPREEPPSCNELDSAGIATLAIFAGDGTIGSIIPRFYGWSGAVLALPGGTMNLLAKRMHGEATPSEIVSAIGEGRGRKVRPSVVRTAYRDAMTGILAGPGTVWNDVREAIRGFEVADFVESATEAIAWSANGPKVICTQADCGRAEGYSAITIVPGEEGLEGNGYYVETVGDYARHGVALLQRDFRNGPHDSLGSHPELQLVCPEGDAMGLLIDGEPFDGAAQENFALAQCGVDLLATADAR